MGRFFVWLKRALESPRAPAATVAVAVLISLPSLGQGISADDFWHKLAFTDVAPDWAIMKNPWWDLFRFFDGRSARTTWLLETGLTPWWSDLEVRAAFFRPVSAATHALDYALWPRTHWLMHAHSIAWFAALVAVASWTYRRLFAGRASPWIARLAAVLYAVDYTHGMPVAWLANRNAIIAGVFAIGSLGAHDVASKESSGRWTALSSGLLLVGLCAGESALGVTALLAAHAVWLDARPRRERALSLAPHVAIVVAWAIVYRAGGFGVRGSGMYIEPLREPLGYLSSLGQFLPLLVASELGAPPPELYPFMPPAVKAGILLGASLFLAWASFTIVRVWKKSALAKMLFAGGVVAALPSCATVPAGRLLTVPGFGLIGAVALAFAGLIEGEAWIPDRGPQRGAVRSFLWWTGLGHLLLCPLAFQMSMLQMPMVASVVRALQEGIPSSEPVPERVVFVNTPDALFIAFVLIDAKIAGDEPRPFPRKLLSMASGQRDIRLTREGARSIVLEQTGGIYRNGTELVMRKESSPMPKGTRVDLGDVTVEVLETTDDGVPRRVVFRFADDPEDPARYAFREWNGRGLVPFTLPAIGETALVAGRLPQLTAPPSDRR